MDDVEITNRGDCCRLCASRGLLLSVWESRNGIIIRDLISKHLNITIEETDKNLSTNMCEGCEEKLLTFHEYFEMCSRVQDWFMKWQLNDTSSKGTVNSEYAFVSPNETFVSSEVAVKYEFIKEENPTANKDASVNIAGETTINNLSHLSNENEAYSITKADPPISVDKLTADLQIIMEGDNSLDHNIDSDLDSDCSAVPLSRLPKFHKKVKKKNTTTTTYQGNCCENIDFHCSVCNLDCHSWYRLKTHSTKMHKVGPVVKCTLCNVTLKSKTVMYRHVAEHKNPSIYKCDKCARTTKSLKALTRHKERHIPKEERIYRCDMCPKIHKTKEALQSHLLSHIPIQQRKIYPCDICEMKFTKHRSMLCHKRTVHEKIKSYMCDVCGYKCATAPELRQHRAIHSDEKLFVCKVCSKGFKTDSNLKTHMDTHDGTSYQCKICSKVLNTRRTFRKHQLVHEVERKFVCSFCNIAFKRRQTLKAHLNSHTGDKPIACKWCNERFMYWASYHNHKRRHHPDKLYAVGQHAT